jgi:hypothetical protein
MKEFIWKHSIKLQVGGSALMLLAAQTPIEYGLSAGLAVHAFLDWKDGQPLI